MADPYRSNDLRRWSCPYCKDSCIVRGDDAVEHECLVKELYDAMLRLEKRLDDLKHRAEHTKSYLDAILASLKRSKE